MNRDFKDLEQKREWAAREMEALKEKLSGNVKDQDIYEFLKQQNAKELKDYRDSYTTFNMVIENSKNPEHVLEVLKMILDGHLLAPIEDKENEFIQKGNIYQSTRWPYLHYMVDAETRERTLIDTRAALTVDINNPREYLFEPFAMSYFYQMCHKLEFPYMPPEDPWVIYIEKCNAYESKIVTYDTLSICYAKLPDQNQLMEIKKYFKRNTKDNLWQEITASEYAFRCKKAGVLDE